MKRRTIYCATAAILLCGCATDNKTETTDKEETVVASVEAMNEELTAGPVAEETGAADAEGSEAEEPVAENIDTEESESTPIDPHDWETQIAFLKNMSKDWELETEIRDGHDYYEAECHDHGYAVTDLDEDGFLEVIKSFYMGNAHSSINRIFEVTADGNLIEWGGDIYEEPDLLMQDTLTLYEDENGEHFYIAYDFASYGVQGHRDRYVQMFVRDDAITYHEICSCEFLVGEKNEQNAYVLDQSISYDEYQEMIRWNQFRELQTIQLHWVKNPEEIIYE